MRLHYKNYICLSSRKFAPKGERNKHTSIEEHHTIILSHEITSFSRNESMEMEKGAHTQVYCTIPSKFLLSSVLRIKLFTYLSWHPQICW